MCGVPIERADDYLNRLIALGHRVAVCEQLEDPAEAKKRGAKSVVKRDVVRLVTPGTITEERLLEPGRARLLVAVQRVRGRGRALDLRPRRARPFDRRVRALGDRRGRASPPRSRASSRARSSPRRRSRTSRRFARTRRRASRAHDAAGARRRRRRRRGARGSATSTASRRSTASAPSRAPRSPPPRWRSPMSSARSSTRGRRSRRRRGGARGASLEIDPATRANLELTRTLGGAREGSLLATIDLTVTPAGARLLAERLASPLTDPAAIGARLDCGRLPRRGAAARDALRRELAGAPDFVRALVAPRPRPRRPARPRRHPRRARRGGGACAHSLGDAEALPAELLRALCGARRRSRRARTPTSQATLADDLPLVRRDGGFVRAGRSAGARRGARLARREPPRDRRDAGRLRRGDRRPAAQDQAQQRARLFRRDAAGAGRDAAQGRRSTRPSSIARPWRARCASPPSSWSSSRPGSPMPPTGRWRSSSRPSSACARPASPRRGAQRRSARALAAIDVAAALAELAAEARLDAAASSTFARLPPSRAAAIRWSRRR